MEYLFASAVLKRLTDVTDVPLTTQITRFICEMAFGDVLSAASLVRILAQVENCDAVKLVLIQSSRNAATTGAALLFVALCSYIGDQQTLFRSLWSSRATQRADKSISFPFHVNQGVPDEDFSGIPRAFPGVTLYVTRRADRPTLVLWVQARHAPEAFSISIVGGPGELDKLLEVLSFTSDKLPHLMLRTQDYCCFFLPGDHLVDAFVEAQDMVTRGGFSFSEMSDSYLPVWPTDPPAEQPGYAELRVYFEQRPNARNHA
jgi:hypothetical protein